MGRTARDKRDRFRPRPVEKIELDASHTTPRLIAAGALLLLGAGLLAYAFMGLFTPETGWQTIEVNTSAGPTCGEDFTFLYEVSSGSEAKELTSLYSELCKKAFQLFHSDQEFEDVVNITSINLHPNEALEVDPALYEALSAAAASGRRELYLGPVYERYDDLFFCGDDSQLVNYDPRLSEDVRAEYAEVLVYANDPQAVSLELLVGNRVRLSVSEGYLSWARQEGITRFIDFAWMRNAFAADYLAGELAAAGYTKGSLSSYDGFARNLDGRGTAYDYPLYHRQGNGIYPAANLSYQGPVSFVQMRDYPISKQDLQHYYQLSNGEIRTSYLDTADALCRSSIDTLVCYSQEMGCAQLLLEMIPVYIADEFREDAVPALAREGIQSIYCRDRVLRYTDPDAVLKDFFNQDGIRYSGEQIALS